MTSGPRRQISPGWPAGKIGPSDSVRDLVFGAGQGWPSRSRPILIGDGHRVGPAAPLGQSINLFHATIEALSAGAGHGIAHRRGAPEDKSEPREVILSHDRVLAQLEDYRRRDRDARRPAILQQLQERSHIEAGQEDERGAGMERASSNGSCRRYGKRERR